MVVEKETEVGVPVEGILTAGTVDARFVVRGNPLLPAEDLFWRFKQRQIFVSARTQMKKLILQRSRDSGDSVDEVGSPGPTALSPCIGKYHSPTDTPTRGLGKKKTSPVCDTRETYATTGDTPALAKKAEKDCAVPCKNSQCLWKPGLGRLLVSASATFCVPAHLIN